jgi:hypothetical protein
MAECENLIWIEGGNGAIFAFYLGRRAQDPKEVSKSTGFFAKADADPLANK